jgi:hypothetical protein
MAAAGAGAAQGAGHAESGGETAGPGGAGGGFGEEPNKSPKDHTKDPRVQSNPSLGRYDSSHTGALGYDKALTKARANAGNLGTDTKKMYDPATGTLIGERSADGKRGWRIDSDHVNWWNWSGGKKGGGGIYGHEFYPPGQSGPHSQFPGYAAWE